jgi:hypothetical protein
MRKRYDCSLDQWEGVNLQGKVASRSHEKRVGEAEEAS